MENDIKHILKQQGFSITKARLEIFNAIASMQPVTIADLILALPQVDRATVYRTVDLFSDLNIVKSITTSLDNRIELGDSLQAHHHHLTCVTCGTVIDIFTPQIEQSIEQTALNNGFKAINHDLEITGYCVNCH